jgi:LytTr DNA-binding domain
MAALTYNSPLHVLIVVPEKHISRGLARDLKFIDAGAETVRRSLTLEEAYTEIEKQMPTLVFLSLDLPESGAQQFLAAFPPKKRPFAIVLVHTPSANPREQMRISRIFGEHHIAGYLPYPLFDNDALDSTILNVRNMLKQQYVSEQQQEIIDGFLRGLQHPIFKLAEKNANHDMLNGSSEPLFRFQEKDKDKVEQHIPWHKVVRLEGSKHNFDVWHINAEGKYSLHIARKEMVVPTLPNILFQVHRSHWVHLAYIQTLTAEEVILINGEKVPLGRTFRQDLLIALEKLSPPLLVLSLVKKNLDDTEHPLTPPTTKHQL